MQRPKWTHAATRLPSLALTAFTRGAFPMGINALNTLKTEGKSDLHWKILGDAIVRFLSHSGPVLTKFGQILATRTDILPASLCKRLEDLYDQQRSMTSKELKLLLKLAYPKGPPFQSFDSKPIGIGSVGQVHRAVLMNGQAVVVKFVRPGSRAAIEHDLVTAQALSEAFFTLFKNQKPLALMIQHAIADLEKGFLSELDLKAEARSIQKFRNRLKSNPQIYVPQCYTSLSSEYALVLEELKGTPLSKYKEKNKKNPLLSKKAAHTVLKEILTQIFDEGHFHADPHGGNLLVLDDGRIGIIDFGLTGELTATDRKQIVRAVKALLARNPEELIQALLKFGTVPKDFDLKAFQKDITAVVRSKKGVLVNTFLGQGTEKNPAQLEQLVQELFATAYTHQVYVPQSTTLLIKTLVTIEGVARSLDPNINLIAVATPIILTSLTPKWLRWKSGLFNKSNSP